MQGPRWIVIDQALDTLDEKVRDQVVSMLAAMDGSAIIATGHPIEGVTLFGRTVELVEETDTVPDATRPTTT